MSPLFAFGMPGFQEWILIGIISLVLFGPKKLPEIARTLGKSMNEFQKAKDEFVAELHKSSEAPKPGPVDTKLANAKPADVKPVDLTREIAADEAAEALKNQSPPA
jgi:sec-independent protein translocase protein TatA